MKPLRTALGASLLLASTLGAAAAQDAAPVRVEGRVVWRSGQTVVIAPDGATSLKVDVSRVPQDQYGVLKEGDRVIVTGAMPNERDRVVAATIERLTP
jgi:hypothetical protein